MVLAIHLEIDAQRRPARAKVGFPLKLHVAPRNQKGPLFAVLVVEGDVAVLGVYLLHRDIKNAARLRMDWQEAGIGLLPLLAQRGQHDFHDCVIALGGKAKGRIKFARSIEFGRRDKLVLEPESIEEPAQHGVVMVAEALVFTEGIGNRGQRLLHVGQKHIAVRHVVGNFAHPIKVVRETNQPRRDIRDHLKGTADHRRAEHFAKGANMRQARRAVARLKEDIALFRRRLFIAFEQRAGFFKGPGFAVHRDATQIGHLLS